MPLHYVTLIPKIKNLEKFFSVPPSRLHITVTQDFNGVGLCDVHTGQGGGASGGITLPTSENHKLVQIDMKSVPKSMSRFQPDLTPM